MNARIGSIATFLLLACALASVFQVSDAKAAPCGSKICNEETCAKDYPDGVHPYPCCVSPTPHSNAKESQCICCTEPTLKICRSEPLSNLAHQACKCKSKTPVVQLVIDIICSPDQSGLPGNSTNVSSAGKLQQ